MKKRMFLFMGIGSVTLFATAQAQDLSYKISGKLENISPMPAKMYLKEVIPAGMLSKPIDSAEVINGQYQFSGNLTTDEAYGVSIAAQVKETKSVNMINLILDKGDLQVISINTIGNSTVTGNGATAQHQYDDLSAATKPTLDSLKAMQASDVYSSDKKLQAEVQQKSMRVAGEYIFNMYNYVKAHPDYRVSPYVTAVLIHLPFLSAAGKDTLVSLLPTHVQHDKLGELIVNTNLRNKAVADSMAVVAQKKALDDQSKIPTGSKAMDFTQKDVNGKQVTLSSFKGKYVLVDFWASWCGPCRAENPNVVKVYQKYKDKGFTVLGVSLDGQSTKDAWVKAIEKDGLLWTQVSELNGWNNSVAKLYDIKLIPQNFLIGPDGTIIGKNLRGQALEDKLAEVLKR